MVRFRNLLDWINKKSTKVPGNREYAETTLDKQKALKTILRVVRLLVDGKYKELVELTNGSPDTAELIKKMVDDYPDSLVMPPSDNWDDLVSHYFGEDYTAPNAKRSSWPVDVKLWDTGGVESELTLQLLLIDSPGEYYDVEIEDLHVL